MLVFASLFLASLVMSHNAFADTVVNTISLGTYQAGSVGVNPQTDTIYVTNPANNTVSVISGSSDSVVDTIPVLSNPSGIAVNPIANKIYVSHPNDNSVSVIDGSTNSVTDRIQIPGAPSCIVVNPNIDMIYVLQSSYHSIAIIDGLTDKIIHTIPYSSGYTIWTSCVGVNPSTDRFYLSWATNPNTHIDHYVDVYNGSTNSRIGTIGSFGELSIVAFSNFAIDKKMDMIYFTEPNAGSSNTVFIINGTSDSYVTGPQVRQDSNAIDVNPYTNILYVANHDNNALYVINGTTRSVTNIVPVGKSPIGVAVNPNTDKIYVTNQGDNTVSVIQGSSPPPQITTSQLRVNSKDSFGNIMTGFQTKLYAQSGTLIDTGNTPHTFTLTNNQNYVVHVENNAKYVFDHWSDTGSTSATRNVSISSDDAIFAIYKTVPQSPTGLSATAMPFSQIKLSWTAPANNGGAPITNYNIYRSTSSGTETLLGTTGNVTTYNDIAVTNGQKYFYKVTAVNSVGESVPSNEASATPATHVIVLNNVQSTSGMILSSPYQITLSNFNIGDGDNRLLVVGASANNNSVISVTFGGSPLRKAVSSFHNNDAELWYMTNPSGTANIVVTMNGTTSAVIGAYAFSGVDQSNPIPNNSTNYNNATSSPTVSITTQYPNSWVIDITSIYGSVTLGSSTCTQQWNVNMPGIITGASSSMTVPSAGSTTCNWTASYSGDFWDDAAIEVKVSDNTSYTVPGSPTGLEASTVSPSQINLSWSAPSDDGGSAITGYEIERSDDGGSSWSTLVSNTGSTSTAYSDTHVLPTVTYTYRVSAINDVGTSSPSNTASASTPNTGIISAPSLP